MSARLVLIAALLTLSLPAVTVVASASAGAAAPRADFADVEDEIMCDTCNVALHIAESPRADQLRDEIRDLVADGLTKDQIKAQLKSQYGANILAEPDKDGLGILAYLLPIAVAAALLGLLAVLLPRWRRRSTEQPDDPGGTNPSGGPASAEDERRLDDELARYGA